MTTFAEVVKAKIAAEVKGVQQGLVCLIDRFDKQTMRADVRPLQANPPVGNSLPEPYPILPNLPVQFLFAGDFYIRPDYQAGDMVWVTFATHDVDNSLREDTLEESKRVFDLSSASVSHAVAPTDWTSPTEFSGAGLLIGHKDGDAYLQFEDDKVTAFFQAGARKVEWSNGGMRFWNGSVWTNFMTHTHNETGAVTLAPNAGT